MDLLAAFAFLFFVWKIRFSKTDFFSDYLSLENTQMIKGIMAVLVVLHHLYREIGEGVLFFFFDNVGVFCVCLFFFFSGYGLQKSNLSKPNYGRQILRRRIPSILIPTCFYTVLYWGLSFLLGDGYTVGEVLRSFVNGSPILENGWYLLCIPVCYAVFGFSVRLFPKNTAAVLWCNSLFALAWAVLCRSLGYGIHWYNSIAAFPAGLFWAVFESRLLPRLQKQYWLYLCLGAAACGGLYILAVKSSVESVGIALCWAAGLFFSLFVLLLLMKFRFGNPVLSLLGKVSFEIYGIHGLFILFFQSRLVYISSPILWGGAVLAATLLVSWLLHACFAYR